MTQPNATHEGQKTALTDCEAAFKKSNEAGEHPANAEAWRAFRAGWYAKADTFPSEMGMQITDGMVDRALEAAKGVIVDTRRHWTDGDRAAVRVMLETVRTVASKEAARYRWLRDTAGEGPIALIVDMQHFGASEYPAAERIDAAIDSAMNATGAGK